MTLQKPCALTACRYLNFCAKWLFTFSACRSRRPCHYPHFLRYVGADFSPRMRAAE